MRYLRMRVCERGLNTEACGCLLFVAVCYSEGWTFFFFFFFPGSESPGVSIGVFALLSRFEYRGSKQTSRCQNSLCGKKAVASSIFNVIEWREIPNRQADIVEWAHRGSFFKHAAFLNLMIYKREESYVLRMTNTRTGYARVRINRKQLVYSSVGCLHEHC